MTYDYHGQWDKRTGHVAPMYYHPDDEYYYFNANYTINYWISKGAPPRTLVMGEQTNARVIILYPVKRNVTLNAAVKLIKNTSSFFSIIDCKLFIMQNVMNHCRNDYSIAVFNRTENTMTYAATV